MVANIRPSRSPCQRLVNTLLELRQRAESPSSSPTTVDASGSGNVAAIGAARRGRGRRVPPEIVRLGIRETAVRKQLDRVTVRIHVAIY